jgi:hypothetical protein
VIFTRSERRSMERAKEKHIKTMMAGGYNEWIDLTDEERSQEVIKHSLVKPVKVYRNGLFIVQVFGDSNSWGATKVMIRWLDARPVHDWMLFQRIKNDLFGPERIAIEVYPAESHKVDVANIYWLWILPVGFSCPVEMK